MYIFCYIHSDVIICSQICSKDFNDHLSWHRVTGIHGVTVDHRQLDTKAMWEVSTLYIFTLLIVYQLYHLCTDSVSEMISQISNMLMLRFNFLLVLFVSSIPIFASIVLFICDKCLTLRKYYANCLRISPVFCASGHAIAFVLWRCKYLFRFLPTIFLF